MEVDDFLISVYIPSLRKHVPFRQLTNKVYKNILKYIESNDEERLGQYFYNIIEKLGETRPDGLNKIDVFCILLTLRIVCIGPAIDLQFTCPKTKKKYKTSIELNNILQNFTDIGESTGSSLKLNDDISLDVGIPENLYTDDDDLVDTMTYCINNICIQGTDHNLGDLAYDERRDIINCLPGEVFNYIVKYSNNLQEKFNESVILVEKSPHYDGSASQEHRLGLYNNSMFNFIRMVFSDRLIGYYEMLYSLSSNVHLSPEYIESLTPAEAGIFLTTRRKELAEQERQQKEADSRNTGPTLPDRFSGAVDNL
jgi:hypothetical protein